jgi:hypothetical protein
VKLAHHRPFQAIGFHSCDREVGLRLLNGTDQLKHSTNSWDWLGWGAYFWEQNPQKALEYAIKCAVGKQTYSGDIRTPFIIGAIIELNNCLNLVEPSSIKIVKEAYKELKETMRKSGEGMPKNKGANRALDCAVIQSIHESNKREFELNPNGEIKPYDTVRSPFHEGGAIYEGSAFTEGLHIEISVINVNLIRGFFLPRPIEIYNPYLNKEFNKDQFLNDIDK